MHKNCCHQSCSFWLRYMHHIVCRLGLCHRPQWGSLQRSPRPRSWFTGWAPPGMGKREGRGREVKGGSPSMPKSRVGKPSSNRTLQQCTLIIFGGRKSQSASSVPLSSFVLSIFTMYVLSGFTISVYRCVSVSSCAHTHQLPGQNRWYSSIRVIILQ